MSKSISPGTLEPRTYADGYGIWHAIIPCDTPEPGKVAARLIMKELALRGEIDPDYTGDEFSHEFTIEQDKEGFITLGICHSAVGVMTHTEMHSAGHAERALDEMFDSVIYSEDN